MGNFNLDHSVHIADLDGFSDSEVSCMISFQSALIRENKKATLCLFGKHIQRFEKIRKSFSHEAYPA